MLFAPISLSDSHGTKSSKDGPTPTAPVQSAGATFFIGDSNAQEKQEASASDPAADASAYSTSSEGVLKESKMEAKSASQDDGVGVTVDDKCSAQDDSAQAKELCRISVGGASTPEKTSKSIGGTAATSNASALPSVTADQSNPRVEV